ncbi:MAG: malto-oligosyltrehalose synthase [Ornithinimicrobium sp.]
MTTAPAETRPVTATYRLQLHAGFTFADAAQIVPYLADLGVSHLYLSPILTAVPGSEHCYDVLDHTEVNPEIGGEDGLRDLAGAAQGHGLGVILDIVPNHMALAQHLWRNGPAWQVLREGPRSEHAHWFDVDWDTLQGKFGLPVLGQPLAQVLEEGELRLDTASAHEGRAAGQRVIRYYDHVFPVAEGSDEGDGNGSDSDDGVDLAVVLERQHYVLASWKEADEYLNYRRFFEVDTLIGVRVEEADVFAATHDALLGWHHEGLIDGFRVDHPDGLADPQAYLDTLASKLRPGTPVWVEKIVEGEERLPPQWACVGTTGYDALAALSASLVDPNSAHEVSRSWARVGGTPDMMDVVESCKRQSVEHLLTPEMNRLLRRAREVFTGHSDDELRAALSEILVRLEVYRAYVRPGDEPTESAMRHLIDAVGRARRGAPDHAEAINALGEVLAAPEGTDADPAAARDLCVRFQQTAGPVMAKSVEDTAFYRWHRLTALNEVGLNPSIGAHPRLREMHHWAQHQQSSWPGGMTTLSTHDTKRSEDVRARLLAVAGDAEIWHECERAAHEAANEHGIDGPITHLIWQTLVGVGPISGRRLAEYLTKAMREAKVHTSWVEVNTEYEGRVLDCAEQARTGGDLYEAIERAVQRSGHQIEATVLAQKLLQLMLPGVPDTYQGTEVLDLSLVDPDNRRPVDYCRRQAALDRIDADEDPSDLSEMKLLVTARALRLRRAMPEVFGPRGSYRPLHAGPSVLGFVRGEQVAVLALRAPHHVDASALRSEHLELDPGRWTDELTGQHFEVGAGGLLAAEAFLNAPVALLVAQ